MAAAVQNPLPPSLRKPTGQLLASPRIRRVLMQAGPEAGEDAVHMLIGQQQVELDKIRTILAAREERLSELVDDYRMAQSDGQGNEEMSWAQAPVGCVSTGTTRMKHGSWDRLQEVGLGGSTSKASVSLICPADADKSSYFLGISSPRVLNNVCTSGEARLELLGVQLLDVQLTGQTLDHMIRREIKLKQDVYKSNVHISEEVQEIAAEFERVQAEYLTAEMEQKRAQRDLFKLQQALDQKRETWMKTLEPWRHSVQRIEREQTSYRVRMQREKEAMEMRKQNLHAKIRNQGARLIYNDMTEYADETREVNMMLEQGAESPVPGAKEEEEEEGEDDQENTFNEESSMEQIGETIKSGFSGMNEVSKVALLETTYKKLLEAKSRNAMLKEERAVSEQRMDERRKLHAELRSEYDVVSTNHGEDSVSRMQTEQVDSKLRQQERLQASIVGQYEDLERRYQPVRNGLKDIASRVLSMHAPGEPTAIPEVDEETGEPRDDTVMLLERVGDHLTRVGEALGFEPGKGALTHGVSIKAGDSPFNIRALDSAGNPLGGDGSSGRGKKGVPGGHWGGGGGVSRSVLSSAESG